MKRLWPILFFVAAVAVLILASRAASQDGEGSRGDDLAQAVSRPAQNVAALTSEQVQSFVITNPRGLSGMVLFTANVDGVERILVADLDARRVRRVIDGPGNNSYPSFHPNGEWFVFVSDRDGNKELYRADWDGGNQMRLTTNNQVDDNPSFSADGRSIVYYSEPGAAGGDAEIYLLSLNPDGASAAPQRITKLGKRNTVPRISPDGKVISYTTNRFWPGWDVCLFDRRTLKEQCVLSGAQTYCRQSFSPDGKSLVYSSGLFDEIDLGVYSFTEGEKTALTDMPGREYDAVYSATGEFVIFAAENGKEDVFNIFISDLEGEVQPLVNSPHSMRFLSWSTQKTLDLEGKRVREQQQGE